MLAIKNTPKREVKVSFQQKLGQILRLTIAGLFYGLVADTIYLLKFLGNIGLGGEGFIFGVFLFVLGAICVFFTLPAAVLVSACLSFYYAWKANDKITFSQLASLSDEDEPQYLRKWFPLGLQPAIQLVKGVWYLIKCLIFAMSGGHLCKSVTNAAAKPSVATKAVKTPKRESELKRNDIAPLNPIKNASVPKQEASSKEEQPQQRRKKRHKSKAKTKTKTKTKTKIRKSMPPQSPRHLVDRVVEQQKQRSEEKLELEEPSVVLAEEEDSKLEARSQVSQSIKDKKMHGELRHSIFHGDTNEQKKEPTQNHEEPVSEWACRVS